MKTFLARALTVASLLLFPTVAFGQSCPAFSYGKVLTAGQWQACFDSKQNALGYTPVNKAGDVMLGRLVTFASALSRAGFNIPAGTAPTSPVNGDVWTTTAGMFVRINAVTIGPLTSGTSSSFVGTSPITVAFPAGVVTYAFDFTVANSFLATQTFRTILAGTTNTYDIGTSATVAAFRTIYAGTSFVGPAGTFTTSVAVGGATLGGNALAVTGSAAISGALTSAAHAITSASANALAVGPAGATNPTLQVDASTATSATGLKIKSAAAAGGLALSVITSGTNEALAIDAAGSGTITLGGTSTGAIIHTRATTLSAALTYGGVTLANAVTGTGNMVLATAPSISALTVTGSFTATGLVTLPALATQTANTFVANVSGATASPTAASLPSCTGPAAALQYTSGTGLSCGTIVASASSITVGVTTIGSGTTTRILYDNAGTLGEYTISGTGTVVAMASSPSFTTPALGVATGTSLALNGCTISTNAFCATGRVLIEGVTSTGATGTGNFVFATAPSVSSLTVTTAFTATALVGLPSLATQAAYSILGNFTSGAASPTASTIGGLTQKASPGVNDILLLQDQAASGQLKYATVASVSSAGSVASISGNTGAFTLDNGITNLTNVIVGNKPINAQTGTSYAIVDGDRGKLVTTINAAAQAYSIAQAGGGGSFASGWYADVSNKSTNPLGVVTITPATSTINGAATLVVQKGQSVRIVSDGTNYQVAALTGARVVKVKTFTATDTYTPSTGMLSATIECVGPGGGATGGTSGATNTANGGSGGSGAYSRAYVTAVQVGASQAVTVGTGGAGGTGSGAASNGSGATSAGALCTAGAGGGSSTAGNAATSTAGSPGAAGTAGTGDVAIAGNPGQGGLFFAVTSSGAAGANGGASFFGGAGLGAGVAGTGSAAMGCGSGGGAGSSYAGISANGGAGANGCVVVTEYTTQ